MSHPPGECPAWGKKCHKCGNKNHFSTQCKSKQSGAGNRKSCSTSRGCKGRGKPHSSRSRSKLATKSAYSIESASFQDHSDDLHGENADDLHGWRKRRPPWKSKRKPPGRKCRPPWKSREKTSIAPTPFKTIWEVLIFLNNHFPPFLGQNLLPA